VCQEKRTTESEPREDTEIKTKGCKKAGLNDSSEHNQRAAPHKETEDKKLEQQLKGYCTTS